MDMHYGFNVSWGQLSNEPALDDTSKCIYSLFFVNLMYIFLIAK